MQKIIIEFNIEVFEPVKNVLFWVKIEDTLGNDIMLLESSKDIFTFIDINTGLAEYRVTVKESLLPREYYLTLAIYKDDGMAIDLVERVRKFKVIKTSENGSDYYRWGKPHGYIYSDSIWVKK